MNIWKTAISALQADVILNNILEKRLSVSFKQCNKTIHNSNYVNLLSIDDRIRRT